MKKCPYCAEEIQDEAIKCKHCGEALKRPKQYGCGTLLLGLIVIGLVGSFISGHSTKDSTSDDGNYINEYMSLKNVHVDAYSDTKRIQVTGIVDNNGGKNIEDFSLHFTATNSKGQKDIDETFHLKDQIKPFASQAFSYSFFSKRALISNQVEDNNLALVNVDFGKSEQEANQNLQETQDKNDAQHADSAAIAYIETNYPKTKVLWDKHYATKINGGPWAGQYDAQGTVEKQNIFGATIRTLYDCRVKKDDNGQWQAVIEDCSVTPGHIEGDKIYYDKY